MLTSIVIPAQNEELQIGKTMTDIVKVFQKHNYPYEIIVVNDGSTDRTTEIVKEQARANSNIRLVHNYPPLGFGNAIKKGLSVFNGEAVIIAMADSSDDPLDMIKYVDELEKGYDCCFGTRWCSSIKIQNYPKHKYLLNRFVNTCINIFYGIHYNDTTNAFKAYRRETIKGIIPILSHHFNITVELPLKAMVRGYSFRVIPTNWYNKRQGESSLKIKEMGSRYLFIIMYIWLEKALTGQDYKKDKIEM